MAIATQPQLTLDKFLKLPETEPASDFINGEIIQKPNHYVYQREKRQPAYSPHQLCTKFCTRLGQRGSHLHIPSKLYSLGGEDCLEVKKFLMQLA